MRVSIGTGKKELMFMKKIIGLVLLVLLSTSVVCFAASRRWYCPRCGSRLEYRTPVDEVSPQDEEKVGLCYDMMGRSYAYHDWRPC